ncbi:recombinase family protein [Actinocrispum wychmicini]|uniref:Resolvase-like protein n=1 Tax=Actinocrispum wychmicini TaxID=1213861 RepID=A0A4V6NNV4_9PSEU|nr:recombinase family protein [Actinocrispum wychmicini]TCO56920.1 resolvase-like protein [Actinocrispum wychmicini]
MSELGLRAIVGSRVSVKRENRRHKSSAKVSHLAQKEIGYQKATSLGATVVDTFEDLDVSAQVSPFDRPDLKDWLNMEERGHEWDMIVWSNLDRGFRDPRDAIALADWCAKNQKIMVLAEQGIVLDYRPDADPMARMLAEMFLLIGSMFAKWELTQHKTRALNAHSILREMDRWPGGPAPEGFKIVAHPSGKGKAITTDVDRKRMIFLAACRLLGADDVDLTAWTIGPSNEAKKDSFNGITVWLTGQRYVTNVDRHRNPDDRRGTEWNVSDTIKFLTSPATQGIKMSGEQPVIGSNGMPLQIAEPTFDDHTWVRIQEAVAERRRGEPNRIHGANPLLGVSYCGKCGSSATHFVTTRTRKRDGVENVYRYYRCARRPRPCPLVGMKSEDVESILEQEFLTLCGDLPVLQRTFVPGEDHTEELNKVKASIARLERESDLGFIRTEEDEKRYFERMQSLVNSKASLGALPQRAAGWEYCLTGETYAQAWRETSEDIVARRKLLVDAGVRFVIHDKDVWEVQVPEDVKERLAKAAQ